MIALGNISNFQFYIFSLIYCFVQTKNLIFFYFKIKNTILILNLKPNTYEKDKHSFN